MSSESCLLQDELQQTKEQIEETRNEIREIKQSITEQTPRDERTTLLMTRLALDQQLVALLNKERDLSKTNRLEQETPSKYL